MKIKFSLAIISLFLLLSACSYAESVHLPQIDPGNQFRTTNATDDNKPVQWVIPDTNYQVDICQYIDSLNDTITAKYNLINNKVDFTVVVETIINKDGSITDVKITNPSTDNEYNNKILQIFQELKPVKPIPATSKLKNIKVAFIVAPKRDTPISDEEKKYAESMCQLVRANWKPSIYANTNIMSSDNLVISIDGVKYTTSAYTTTRSRNITCEFTVTKNGSLSNTKLLISSGNKLLDKSALDAIARTRFKPLPKEFTKETITMIMTFNFSEHFQH